MSLGLRSVDPGSRLKVVINTLLVFLHRISGVWVPYSHPRSRATDDSLNCEDGPDDFRNSGVGGGGRDTEGQMNTGLSPMGFWG